MFDVVALGELLIDFTPHSKSEEGMNLFEQNPGGACANVLCTLSNFGIDTAFIGKVGKDIHGDFLCSTLLEKKVNITGLIQDKNVFTTLAFVELSENGERRFSFARKPGADTCLKIEELNFDLLKNCKIFHFGSLSLTNEPSRSATHAAICAAKESGALISYDPNYRHLLWKNKSEAVMEMNRVLDSVDILKISEEEMLLLTDTTELSAAAHILLKKGIKCVVITLGEHGSFISTNTAEILVSSLKGIAVDTTGAGDAFWGGFLYKLIRGGINLEDLELGQLKDYVLFANVVAGLCVQKRGAIPSLPSLTKTLLTYEEHKYMN